eukprot:349641-Chlamydomonas_euryale.AAC.6
MHSWPRPELGGLRAVRALAEAPLRLRRWRYNALAAVYERTKRLLVSSETAFRPLCSGRELSHYAQLPLIPVTLLTMLCGAGRLHGPAERPAKISQCHA